MTKKKGIMANYPPPQLNQIQGISSGTTTTTILPWNNMKQDMYAAAPTQVRFRVEKADNGFIVYVDDVGHTAKCFVYSSLEELRDRFIAEIVAGTRLDK